VISILAGDAIARFRFAGRQTFVLIFLATLAVVRAGLGRYLPGPAPRRAGYRRHRHLRLRRLVERALSAGLLFMVGQYEIQWGQPRPGW
jgi:hypothetical protein